MIGRLKGSAVQDAKQMSAEPLMKNDKNSANKKKKKLMKNARLGTCRQQIFQVA